VRAFTLDFRNYLHTSCIKQSIGAQNMQFDRLDLKILAELQRDGRLTNNDLSERIGLSASQCSRRRARLEDDKVIRGYRADIDRQKMGMGLLVVISVTLATHNRDNAKRFARLLADLPEVLEAFSLTGEMDYHLKVATKDLAALSHFVNEVLLPHDSVQHVKTSIVLNVLKDFEGLAVDPDI
jgi:DNA-binding Lrp family transcriptional regulator